MMLCKNPFRRAHITNKEAVLRSSKVRLDATPFPCGQCIPCRINRSRVWQTRLMLEGMMWTQKVFITLTYKDEEIPEDGLSKKDIQNFVKYLRRRMDPNTIRYFIVGEYGPRTDRPHYHGILYNVSEVDSEIIKEVWSKGFVMVGNLTKQSARYVVGYVMKGIGEKRDDGKTSDTL